MVATLMLDSALSSLDLDSLAGIAIHEAFHVYQFGNPSVWPFANEADRFFYPVTDVDLMALRRQEIEALRRAIESTSLDAKMGWAKRAVRARQERFARMDTRLVEYERRTEKVEGLAAYVEAMAVRRTPVDNLDVNLR